MLDRYSQMQKERMGRILECILRSRQITRNKLSHRLQMSSSSIVKYTRELMDLGFLREEGQEHSSGGRRRSFLEFDPRFGYNLVIQFHLSRLEGALINPAGEIVIRKRFPVTNRSKDELLDTLFALIDHLKLRADQSERPVFGIGIGMGDHLDMQKGISHYYHLCSDWQQVNLKELIETRYSLPFFLINDIDAAALGELYYGNSKGISNSLTLWVGETLGMGLILNDNIYLANHGFVGEIGHTLVDPDGPLCSCGNSGCLETVTTESFILQRCREGAAQGVNTQLMSLGNPDSWTMEQVIDVSNQGDRFCRNIIGEVAGYLGHALADTANILNPQRVILSGSVTRENQFLLDSIQHIVSQRVLKPIGDQIELVLSDNPDMPLIGIGCYVLSQFFHN